jgi:hypothetical protein
LAGSKTRGSGNVRLTRRDKMAGALLIEKASGLIDYFRAVLYSIGCSRSYPGNFHAFPILWLLSAATLYDRTEVL